MGAKGILCFERGIATLTKLDLNMTSIERSVIWMVSVHLQRAEETVSIQYIHMSNSIIHNIYTIYNSSHSVQQHERVVKTVPTTQRYVNPDAKHSSLTIDHQQSLCVTLYK